MARYFDLLRFALTQNNWTPITVPIPCHRIVIENTDLSNSIFFRVEEGGAEKEIPAGQELDIDSKEATWNPGDIIGACRPSAASATACVSYTR